MVTLYVFVDESGSHARGRYYTVAGCWCVSSGRPGTVLSGTVSDCKEYVSNLSDLGSDIRELKGSRLPGHVFDNLFRSLEGFAYADDSVTGPEKPWDEKADRPVRFSVHNARPDVGIDALSEFLPEPDAPGAIQTLSLLRVLNPLFHANRIRLEHVDTVRVLLDAPTWKRTVDRVENRVRSVLPIEDVSFEIRDSEKTPGIQIADIVAYSWAKNVRTGNYGESVDVIDELRFPN